MRAQPGKLLVVSKRCGRLANRLVLFANVAAFAEHHSHRAVNCTFHSFAHLFPRTLGSIWCSYPTADVDTRDAIWRRWIRQTRFLVQVCRLGAALASPRGGSLRPLRLQEQGPGVAVNLDLAFQEPAAAAAKVIFLHGWTFRSPASLRACADHVRTHLAPSPAVQNRTRSFLERFRVSFSLVVGVHLRQGDYRTWRKGKYFFNAACYARWMHEFVQQFPGHNVLFIIASDETFSKHNFPGLNVEFAAGSAVEDLHLLSQSDYLMGPVSSFSQWASFYGNTPLLHLRSESDAIEREKFAVNFLEEIPR